MKYHTPTLAVLGLLLAAAPAAFSAPTVVNGVATYSTSQNIGSVVNGKYQPQGVPSTWTKIVINANVTLTGRFDFSNRTTDLTFEGKDPNTSIIKGWKRSEDSVSSDKAGIHRRNYSSSGKLTIKSLKIQDQPGRGIMGWGSGTLNVTSCNIVQTPNDSLTDGVHANNTGDITFSSINVHDDGTYATMCDYINNVKFTHRNNGGPIQIAWGQHTGGGQIKTVTNCTFVPVYNGDYNSGIVDWKRTQVNNDSIKLKMTGTTVLTPVAPNVAAPNFSFGNRANSQVTVGAKIQVNGWTTTKVRQFGTSTGTVSSY